MANECTYSMKVVGKRENVEEFIKVMKSDYNYSERDFEFQRHMGARIFDVHVENIIDLGDGNCDAFIEGSCAWSVYSCMFDGNYTYYKEFKEEYGDKSRSTTIPIESKNLGLDIEIYSEEPGCAFQEHFLVKQGEMIIEDCINFEEYCLDDFDSKEEAEEELGIKIDALEWKHQDYITRGGYEIWAFQI